MDNTLREKIAQRYCRNCTDEPCEFSLPCSVRESFAAGVIDDFNQWLEEMGAVHKVDVCGEENEFYRYEPLRLEVPERVIKMNDKEKKIFDDVTKDRPFTIRLEK